MSVYDRWHKSRPAPGETACRDHDKVPTAAHGSGRQWQSRGRNENGVQWKRNFAKKVGKDPEVHADAYDAKMQSALDDGSYIDPAAAATVFQAFAEDWRKSRTHDVTTAERVEIRLRLHAYADPATPGRTPTGAPAIGHLRMRELERRPSLVQAWIAGMRLAPNSARLVIRDVSSVFLAAIDDRLINRNPLAARSIQRPAIDENKAQPWTLAMVEAMAGALPARYSVLPYLGAGTGMRQGEMFGLAVPEIDFLRKVVHVRRQVRIVGSTPCFAPVKNDKQHDVPLSGSLGPVLAEHIRKYPPLPVTLPWKEPGGRPVTFTLLVTRPGGNAVHRTAFNRDCWHTAQVTAGIVEAPARGQKRAPARDMGMHALRHTAASAWLSSGVDIAPVAAWLGDTVKTVYETYAHMMPGADDRGRRAMDLFFQGSALFVPSEGAL